jgi:glucose/arabinose dehydrogenase
MRIQPTFLLIVLTAVAVAGGCATTDTALQPSLPIDTAGFVTGGAAVPTPQVNPDERDALLATGAVSYTLRPAKREFSDERLRGIRVPAGFHVSVFARDLENPRTIRVHERGGVYIAEREAGRVRYLRDSNGDGVADVSAIVASGLGEKLSGVHGLAIRGNELYMVTEQEIHVAEIRQDGSLGKPRMIVDDLPDGSQHPNRTLDFGPDGRLYVSVGSACNACVEPNEEHATLLRMNPDGSDRMIFARGLRNTIAFTWHPVTRRLYGLDHNTDGRGNEWPVEEVNHIEEGRHYGWPWCWGDRQIDVMFTAEPEGQTRREFCDGSAGAIVGFEAHAAPMQMVYYTAGQFPAEYRNDAFFTVRGSWNRNPAVGYGVARLRHDANGNPMSVETFADGWLIENGTAQFGRLMGIAVTGDGSLLIGDDENGIIYRIRYAASE